MKKIIWGIVVVIVVVAGGWLAYRYLLTPVEEENLAAVRRGSLTANVDALGRVVARRDVALSARVSGQVVEIPVKEGDVVAEGDLLVALDAAAYDDAVALAKERLALRREQLEKVLEAPSASEIRLARARLLRATAARQRAQDDYDEVADKEDAEDSEEALDLAVARLEYEIAEAEYNRLLEGASETEIQQAQLALTEAERALEQALAQLEGTRVHATFGGTVMQVRAQVSENVHGFTPLVRIADLTDLVIRAEIDEIDVAQVDEGQTVEISLDAFPGETLAGEIERLLPGTAEARGATTYVAMVSFAPATLEVRPGMSASLSIVTERAEDVLLVPRRAVQRVGRFEVVRVLEGRQINEVVVTTGLSSDSEVEVLSGLTEGQRIVLD
jgi:HlyD family secretion protein